MQTAAILSAAFVLAVAVAALECRSGPPFDYSVRVVDRGVSDGRYWYVIVRIESTGRVPARHAWATPRSSDGVEACEMAWTREVEPGIFESRLVSLERGDEPPASIACEVTALSESSWCRRERQLVSTSHTLRL